MYREWCVFTVILPSSVDLAVDLFFAQVPIFIIQLQLQVIYVNPRIKNGPIYRTV